MVSLTKQLRMKRWKVLGGDAEKWMSCECAKALQPETSNGLMPNYSESVAMFWLIIYDVENTVIFLLSYTIKGCVSL